MTSFRYLAGYCDHFFRVIWCEQVLIEEELGQNPESGEGWTEYNFQAVHVEWMREWPWDVEDVEGCAVKMALFDINGIAVVKDGEPIWSLEIISCWSRSNVELIFFPKEKAGSNKHENEYIGPILQALNEITALDISFYLPDTASTRKNSCC